MSRSNQLAGLLTADPPSALDTINEINTALGNDASLSTTLTNSIATKAPLASPTFTGDAVFDTSTLKVDSSNNRVGIGTASPHSILNIKEPTLSSGQTTGVDTLTIHQGISAWTVGCGPRISFVGDASRNMAGIRAYVFGTEDTGLAFEYGTANLTGYQTMPIGMVLNHVGNVGIGTTSPADKMELSHNGTLGLRIRNTNNSGYSQIVFGTGSSASSFCTIRHERVGADQGKLHITKPNDGSGGNAFTIDHTGKAGIGTDAPQKHLEIHDTSNIAYLLINGGGGDGSMTSALQLGGRSASGGNQLAEVSAIRIGDTRGQLVFSTKSSANTLTQRGGFYHGGRSDAREQAFAIQNKRIIYNWYDITAGNYSYKHIKTSLWMGGTQSNSYGYSGNVYYWMGGWRFYAYRYRSNYNLADTSFFFHNWNGSFVNVAHHNSGSWSILSNYYTSSDGFACLRLEQNPYLSGHMEMYQVFASYPFRDVYVIAETNTDSSSNQY